MSAIVNKTKNDGYKAAELQREINADVLIVPSCLSITGSGNNLSLEFAAALSVDEETELDAIILAHVPPVDVIGVTELPISTLDGHKLAVHSSPKPARDGQTTYAVWAGSGDNTALAEDASLGAGDLLDFSMTQGNASETKEIYFDARHGRVWVHEAYIKYEDAGAGCTISADVVAPATPLQQSVDKDYNMVNNWLVYAGPGAGSHGLAGSPVLVQRTYSNDGDWNYDGVDLTPNVGGTGEYKITCIERTVHRYINRIPLYGSTTNYFTLSSDESTELPVNLGYFMRVTIDNASDSAWHLCAIMEIFRERTYMP